MRSVLVIAFSFLLNGLTFAQTHAPDAGTVPNKPSTATAAQPTATFETSMGNIHCTLFPDKAPVTVANFIGLATGKKQWTDPKTGQKETGKPLYDGTIFHRVIPDFMIQGGDPLGTGTGDPGYKFKDEFTDDLNFDVPGRLAMANSGPNTNGSQFFITEVPTPHLNHHHTIFGQCEDLELVKKIGRVPVDRNDKPRTPVVIKHVVIADPRHAASSAPKNTKTKTSVSPQ
jgi:cyclophilin family peptidyl-prolyl cis-trans isomerase